MKKMYIRVGERQCGNKDRQKGAFEESFQAVQKRCERHQQRSQQQDH
jgi:hypothetical protein